MEEELNELKDHLRHLVELHGSIVMCTSVWSKKDKCLDDLETKMERVANDITELMVINN